MSSRAGLWRPTVLLLCSGMVVVGCQPATPIEGEDASSPAADAAPVDTSAADALAADTSTPDASVPDTFEGTDGNLPDIPAAADTALPDFASPDAASPDAASPDAASPDSAEPDSSTPDANTTDAAPAPPFILRGEPASYHVVSSVTVSNSNATLARLSVQLPAPQSNPYQDVSNLSVGAGELLDIPETDDRYVLFSQTSGLPDPGESITYEISYDVTLYDLQADLASVTALEPYDTGADAYLWYTGASGVYVVPDDLTIESLATTLWDANPDVLSYARACYQHVASSYDYLNPNTGLHPLADILAVGGGDCGNLSSIFVSLLRARDIPARHLITVRPDGSYHVWADFLLQGYGWVPVDVTYEQSNPSGDYFGVVGLASNGVIMNKEVDLTLDRGPDTHQLPLLQTYAWWYWSSTSSPQVSSSFELTATPL